MTDQPTTPDVLDRHMRPTRPLGPRIFRWVIGVVVIVPALWSATGLNVPISKVLDAPSLVWRILVNLAQPDLSAAAIQRALPKVMESFYIAWIGTMIGAFFSFPLAFLAAKNVSTGIVANPVRQLLNAIRAVPELLVAMVLIPVTGLGAWTGTLALGIHSIGTLGKLSSEVIEGIDQGPVEAVAAVGGGPVARMRASAVLGIIGAGGIGSELISQLRFRDYGRAGTVLFLTIIAVLTVDTISARVRRRIISGHREPGPVAAFQAGAWWKRALMLAGAAAALALVVFLAVQLQSEVSLLDA